MRRLLLFGLLVSISFAIGCVKENIPVPIALVEEEVETAVFTSTPTQNTTSYGNSPTIKYINETAYKNKYANLDTSPLTNTYTIHSFREWALQINKL